MDLQPVHDFDYDSLAAQGLKLSREDFYFIGKSINQGILDVKKHLHVENDTWSNFLFTDNVSILGYTSKYDALSLPMRYLNIVASNSTLLPYRDQMVCFVENKFFVIIKYVSWLQLLGRETAIHHYQKVGNPMLKVHFPDQLPKELALKSFLLSDLEVEARTMVDAISEQYGENPIWKRINQYFAENYADYYNKPIEQLVTLPKPTIPITYEMEAVWFNVYQQ